MGRNATVFPFQNSHRPNPPPHDPASAQLLPHARLHDVQLVAVSGRDPGNGAGLLCVRVEEDGGVGTGRGGMLPLSNIEQDVK